MFKPLTMQWYKHLILGNLTEIGGNALFHCSLWLMNDLIDWHLDIIRSLIWRVSVPGVDSHCAVLHVYEYADVSFKEAFDPRKWYVNFLLMFSSVFLKKIYLFDFCWIDRKIILVHDTTRFSGKLFILLEKVKSCMHILISIFYSFVYVKQMCHTHISKVYHTLQIFSLCSPRLYEAWRFTYSSWNWTLRRMYWWFSYFK